MELRYDDHRQGEMTTPPGPTGGRHRKGTAMPEGKDIEKATDKSIDVRQAAVVKALELIMLAPEASDDDEAVDMIIARILSSANKEELLNPSSTTGMEGYATKDIIVHDIRRRPSTLNPKIPWYLLVDVETVNTGEHAICSTGATNVMVKLAVANAQGWLPLHCHLVETVSNRTAKRKIQNLVASGSEPF